MKKLLLFLFLTGCSSKALIKLASEYGANIGFFEQAQRDLRQTYSDCDFERECFEEEALHHIEEKLCSDYQKHNFVSEKECERASRGLMDLVLEESEASTPANDLEVAKLVKMCKKGLLRFAPLEEEEKERRRERNENLEDFIEYYKKREEDFPLASKILSGTIESPYSKGNKCLNIETIRCLLKECEINYFFHNRLTQILKDNDRDSIEYIIEDKLGCPLRYKICR